MFCPQLSTCGIDVASEFLADGRLDMFLEQEVVKEFDVVIRRTLKAVLHDRIVRNQIDISEGRCNQLGKLPCTLDGIIDILDEDIFEGDPSSAGIFAILKDGRDELFQRIGLVDRHDPITDFIRRSMQGYGKIDLQSFLSELQDARNDTTGRYRDMPGTDVQSELAVDDADEGKDVVIVVKRFARTHDDDMGDMVILIPASEKFIKIKNLAEHLARGEVSFLLEKTGRTEGTGHVAADLAGYTDAVSIDIVHQNAFDLFAVREAEKTFDGAILALLHETHTRKREIEFLLQLLTEVLGDVAHVIKALHTLLIQP